MVTTTIVTGAQFDALPYDEGRQWELITGIRIPVSSSTPRHQDIVFESCWRLRLYLKESGAAARACQDVEFALTANDRVRPDARVLLAERAALPFTRNNFGTNVIRHHRNPAVRILHT